MTYYCYIKIDHLAKDFRSRKEVQVQNLDNTRKNKIVEKEEKELKNIWARKVDDRKEVKSKEVGSSLIEGETSMEN